MPDTPWLYYSATPAACDAPCPSPAGLTCEMWRPRICSLRPKGMPLIPFAVWWLFHAMHLFWNGEYGLFVIRQGEKVVHRSVITPGYARFPFMEIEDIQVGDTWTDPELRGRGLATIALETILRDPRNQNRKCWYVVEATNPASIRVAEKAGFQLTGRGMRTRRFGLGVLGQFLLTESITAR